MSASKQTILSVEHLKKYFQTASGQLHAVDDINFTLAKGETLGVVGESGCGKSTLGRTILRLHEPTDGKVIFDGKDVTACSKQEMKKLREDMQIIFQDPFASINPRMTVSQTIAKRNTPMVWRNIWTRRPMRKPRSPMPEPNWRTPSMNWITSGKASGISLTGIPIWAL